MKALFRVFLSVLSMPVFSRIYGRLTRIKRPRFLVREIIDFFKDIYKIDMDEYLGSPSDYASLSDFFVRPLDPRKRPLIPKEEMIVSPADGVIRGIETIHEDKATQVKGMYYAVSDVIREPIDFSKGWHLATIYLSPRDYHRYHYPVSGKIKGYCHARGSLFPVNSIGMTSVKKLFARNERVVTRFNKNGLPLFTVAVGATFVGGIRMVFIDSIKRDKRWKELDLEVKQLDEMGRFELGSTIILLVPKALAQPLPGIKDQPVKVGDPIFSLNK
ncbi:MAG: phosphatidylserine decarboxylase [Candidatus Aminicenantes bacterium]|nr:phosphatidylserine decarboxylase [Candidatus Aminicenantes bacterium]